MYTEIPRPLLERQAALLLHPAGRDVDTAVTTWPARLLVEIDSWMRNGRRAARDQPDREQVLAQLDPGLPTLPYWSMQFDGWVRQAAVEALAARPGPAADRLLALRATDHVPQVRRAAWEALAARRSVAQADAVVPVLVALRHRRTAADALARYAELVADVLVGPLWAGFLAHPERAVRRWAVLSQLTAGIDAPQALQQLARERDSLLARALTEVACQDPQAAPQLLTARRAVGRCRALQVVADDQLPADRLAALLLDRSALVRRRAAYRAERRGWQPRDWYRARWEEQHDPRALAGLLEAGGTIPRTTAHQLLRVGSTIERRLALRALARAGIARADLGLLWPLLTGAVAPAAVRALAGAGCWGWDDLAGRWQGASSVGRRRVWRLLVSRRGWSEVRAHLLAATDPALAHLGAAGLATWARHRAHRMFQSPTPTERADIARLLAAADISPRLRAEVAFTARLGGGGVGGT
ncbi:hypothetical protein [Buchananella hordeovulneris]|uniref:hypothetical protein n=1 Tax=Buchananella hordeovulneris TaxID=52770 RepID=UPI000F5E33E7|nr:hypothetical protein [Buchananella hordeovulneris]RRD42017.1 hypothetical protein EII13_10385 [Buchananella hordeovulneris]